MLSFASMLLPVCINPSFTLQTLYHSYPIKLYGVYIVKILRNINSVMIAPQCIIVKPDSIVSLLHHVHSVSVILQNMLFAQMKTFTSTLKNNMQ